MVNQSETQFEGFECIRVENDKLSLWVTRSVGPRVIGLSAFGRENIFAVLPNAKSEFLDQEDYYFRGGHRLWYAPEHPKTTYLPDNQPVTVEYIEKGITVVQPVERFTGIQKTITIELSDSNAEVEIEHSLTNLGQSEIELAPWAITQIRPGGVGIIPQQTTLVDEHGFLPNRHLVLWPYTKIKSPHIHWGDQVVFIDANMSEDVLKVGFPNPDGWLAYTLDGMLFVKRAPFDPSACYLDRGASSEVYCCKDFIELETLGPRVNLQPGDTVNHKETWQIYLENNWPVEIAVLFEEFGKE